jgi:hypothetical protein
VRILCMRWWEFLWKRSRIANIDFMTVNAPDCLMRLLEIGPFFDGQEWWYQTIWFHALMLLDALDEDCEPYLDIQVFGGWLIRGTESHGPPMPSGNGQPVANGGALEAPADHPDLVATIGGADRTNAGKLLSALREKGAVDEDSHSSEGWLRLETGLTEREYRKATKLLKDEKAVRTKRRVGIWLVS